MESLLLVQNNSSGNRLDVSQNNTSSNRKLCIQPKTASSANSHVLLLEKLGQPQKSASTATQEQSINCTARFLPSSSFDSDTFTPLMRTAVYGCLGLIQIEKDPFVCVITDCNPVGKLDGSTIYRINNVMFFSLTSNKYDDVISNGSAFIQARDSSASGGATAAGSFYDNYGMEGGESQYETVKHPCSALQRFLSSGSFYFSYDFDLTKPAQKRNQTEYSSSAWDDYDDRFFWNENMIRELLRFRRQLSDFDRSNLDQEGILVMAISGFVRIDDIQIGRDLLKCAIISRLSCKRAGTRFNTRGVDDDGNVANNAETELLIYSKNHCFSYVIVRGSVPLFWEQQGIQLGQHRIQISRSQAATQPAVERHFDELVRLYGTVHVINLLSQKDGAEGLLGDSFNQHVRALENSSLVAISNFDFHQAVKGNQYENLNLLINELRSGIKKFSFFAKELTGERRILSAQSGAFRVNCLDCLDRTNVVEGMICKQALSTFAQSISLSSDYLYSSCLNDFWADNGDELSRIYTGTGALKSGFTRTGKRTIAGFMDDAKKSAARFYMNNFQDKSKQEIIDHMLGKLSNQPQIRLFNPIREQVLKQLNQRSSEYSSNTEIKVHVATYNVNGKQPLGENLIPWLSFNHNEWPEIYVIGFQEIVELSPQQIMATDNTKRLVWEDLILKTLNARQGPKYMIMKSGQLVGAALIVIVRADCLPKIRNVFGAVKKTGLAGLAGNKGGIAVRMDYNDTAICFVCAHLAAGHSNVKDRNTDYRTINGGLTFEKGLKIDQHDIVVWLGDFNYRINLENEQCRTLIAKRQMDVLLARDQLIEEMRFGHVFQGFHEAKITFPPTYKFDAGTNDYDTSEKTRIPAWTDRILYSGANAIAVEKYERSELVSSDHKPVKALIKLRVQIIDKDAKEAIQQQLYTRYSNMNASTTPIIAPDSPFVSVTNVPVIKVAKLIDFDEPLVAAPILPPRPGALKTSASAFNSLLDGDPFSDAASIESTEAPMPPPRLAVNNNSQSNLNKSSNQFIDNPFDSSNPWS